MTAPLKGNFAEQFLLLVKGKTHYSELKGFSLNYF